METVWIQIFILTLAECVAPAGKTVCQEQHFEMQFLSRGDCEYALEQLISMKDKSDNVIVNHQKSGCAASAIESDSYSSLEAISQANTDTVGWRAPGEIDSRRAAVNKDHSERLTDLMSCEETSTVVPCKIGDIIVEEATGDSVEIWKSD